LPRVVAGEHANALRWKLMRASDPSETNSPNSPHSPGESYQTSANSPDEIGISSDIYHVRGEFGEFHPTAAESLGKKSSQVVTTEPSEPAAQPSADVQVSADVENDIYLTMRMNHVITQFVEA
jgi:hypothetical protein